MVKLALDRPAIRVQTIETGIEEKKEYVSGVIRLRHHDMGHGFYVVFSIRMAYQINREIYVYTGEEIYPIRIG